jgi:hypothetical protein
LESKPFAHIEKPVLLKRELPEFTVEFRTETVGELNSPAPFPFFVDHVERHQGLLWVMLSPISVSSSLPAAHTPTMAAWDFHFHFVNSSVARVRQPTQPRIG